MCVITLDEAKELVLATCLQMVKSGLVLGTSGNVSQRVGENQVVISPSAIPYESLEKNDMVVIDKEGHTIEGIHRPSSEYPMHLAIYKKRPDIAAIMHTHSPYASAFAVARKTIPAILEEVSHILKGPVPVTKYAPIGTEELAREAAHNLEQNNAILLANHGVVGVGENLEQALTVCLVVEKTAQVYLMAQQLGTPYIVPAQKS